MSAPGRGGGRGRGTGGKGGPKSSGGPGRSSPRGTGRSPAPAGGRGAGPSRDGGRTGRPTGGDKPARGPARRGAPGRGASGASRTRASEEHSEPFAGGGGTRRSGRGVGGDQVEGRQAVRELLLAGKRKVREILVSADLDGADIIDEIMELATEAHVSIKEIGRGKLDALARTDAPQGIIARAAELEPVDLDDLCATNGTRVPFLLALDGVTDPGNLGALLRSAECAGVTGVVLPRHRSVHVTPAVTKTAAGAIEHLPIALVGGLPTAIDRMKKLGVWSVGLDETGPRTLWELESLDAPVVMVLGAEGKGLSRLTRERCDQVARIPMRGRLDSLNVSVAGALACFEIARARRQS